MANLILVAFGDAIFFKQARRKPQKINSHRTLWSLLRSDGTRLPDFIGMRWGPTATWRPQREDGLLNWTSSKPWPRAVISQPGCKPAQRVYPLETMQYWTGCFDSRLLNLWIMISYCMPMLVYEPLNEHLFAYK